MPHSSSCLRRWPTPRLRRTYTTAPPSPRWAAELSARIGRCIQFGCSSDQVYVAAEVLRVIGSEWRELTAGSEGYATRGKGGLEGQNVVWGEMDSFVRSLAVCYEP
jgi:hypothetical protein